MRLSADQIRQAIVHPDWDVRHMALTYFQDSFSADPAVMPGLIDAVEKYGWEEAFGPTMSDTPLRQTAETVTWLVEQLRRPCPNPEREPLWNSWTRFLSWQLNAAAVELVAPLELDLAGLVGLSLDCREIIETRLRDGSMDAETGWRELQSLCAERVNDDDPIEFADDDFERLCEVILRGGDLFTKRVLEILDEPIDDLFEDDPRYWMRAAAVYLAGYLRLEAAIPALIDQIESDVANDGQWLCYRCTDALIRIGTDSVILAIAGKYPDASWDMRAVSISVFHNIHSECAVREGRKVLADEADHTLLGMLAHALLYQFDDHFIEPVRDLILQGKVREEEDHAIRLLIGVTTMMGVTIPETEPWRVRAREAADKFRSYVEGRLTEDGTEPDDWDNEFEDEEGVYDFDDEFGTNAFEDALDDDELSDDEIDVGGVDFGDFFASARTPDDDAVRPFVNSDPKVGRNDPCPCGSGKKFKKCCMNRQKNPPKIDW